MSTPRSLEEDVVEKFINASKETKTRFLTALIEKDPSLAKLKNDVEMAKMSSQDKAMISKYDEALRMIKDFPEELKRKGIIKCINMKPQDFNLFLNNQFANGEISGKERLETLKKDIKADIARIRETDPKSAGIHARGELLVTIATFENQYNKEMTKRAAEAAPPTRSRSGP